MSAHEIHANKKYKIETKDTKIKAKIYKINDSTITIIKKGIKTEIALSNIKEIKKRKFSYLKTISLPIVYVGLGIGYFALILSL